MDSYANLQSSEGAPGEPPDYDQTVYRPRQYVSSAYAGWDYLTLASTGINQIRTGDWFVVRLNRLARLAVLWRHGFDGNGRPTAVPGWLASWTRGADSDGLPVFVKDVEAGEHTLGAVKDPGPQAPPLVTPYWLLLAEAGGVPSAPPAQARSPAALPNQRCPAWVHDQYTVVVDGVRFATWHRQIDPMYWCSFGHEHGSDPALFGDGR